MLAIEEEIFQASIARGVLLVKGTFFRPEADCNSVSKGTQTVQNGAVAVNEPQTEMFFRTTFASVDGENIVEGIRRFGAALREVFGL